MTRLSPPVCVLVCGMLTSACAPKHAQTPTSESPDLAVLLADPGTTKVGKAIVSNPHGAVDLGEKGAGARIVSGAAPERTSMSEAEVQRVFGDALASLPPPPHHFVLYFRFDS